MGAMMVCGIWLQQDPTQISRGNSVLLMIFVGLIAVALTIQAVAVILIALGASKLMKRSTEIMEEIRGKALPFIHTAHDLVEHTAPKVKVIAENLAETSHVVRAKALEFDSTASDLNLKTKTQVARVNGMVTSTLDAVTDIGETLQRGVKIPLREISGIVNGFKAGMDVLVGRVKGFGRQSPKVTVVRETDDLDL